ncbi:MAG: hypothetical protein HYY25_14230, partial [Candidatus Wallbacteria bacterium]|nr:hypothetical protein [Candidatus Wallbacteria bacterium]
MTLALNTLYLTQEGLSVRKDGETVVVWQAGKDLTRIPLHHLVWVPEIPPVEFRKFCPVRSVIAGSLVRQAADGAYDRMDRRVGSGGRA